MDKCVVQLEFVRCPKEESIQGDWSLDDLHSEKPAQRSLVLRESTKVGGSLDKLHSEKPAELVLQESTKVGGSLDKLHSEKPAELVLQESTKFGGSLDKLHSEKPGELVLQESTKVGGSLDNIHSEKPAKLVLQESTKVGGSLDKLHSEKPGELVLQESTKVGGSLDNIHSEKPAELMLQESTKVDGSLDNIHSEKPAKLVLQESTKGDGSLDNIHSEKPAELVLQESTKVGGSLDELHSDKPAERVLQESTKVDGSLDKLHTEKQAELVLQESTKVGGSLDKLHSEKPAELVLQESTKVGGSRDDLAGYELDVESNTGDINLEADLLYMSSVGQNEADNLSNNVKTSTTSMAADVLSLAEQNEGTSKSEANNLTNDAETSANRTAADLLSSAEQKDGSSTKQLGNFTVEIEPFSEKSIEVDLMSSADRHDGNASNQPNMKTSDNPTQTDSTPNAEHNLVTLQNNATNLLIDAKTSDNPTEANLLTIAEELERMSTNPLSTFENEVEMISTNQIAAFNSFAEQNTDTLSNKSINVSHDMETFKNLIKDNSTSSAVDSMETEPKQQIHIENDVETSEIPIVVDLPSQNDDTLPNPQTIASSKAEILPEKSTISKRITNATSESKLTGESKIPKGCKVEPTYVNQGAVKKSSSSKPGYPVVLEYECDPGQEEKYKYFSGPREALCDDQGNWTLPAMNCVPTSCYTKLTDKSGRTTVLYGGQTDRTKGGRECQAWMEDEPHSHARKYISYSGCTGCGFANETGNKCRDMSHEKKPWCYTMDPDKRYEHCDVKECKSEHTCARPPILRGAPAVRTELIGQKLHVTYRCHPSLKYINGRNVSICDMKTGVWDWSDLLCSSEDCYYYDRDQWTGAVYHGSVSGTETGRKCQRWDRKWPQWHEMTAKKFHGIRSLSELDNVCRDPDDSGAPWCYTTDRSKRWEFCGIPECPLHQSR